MNIRFTVFTALTMMGLVAVDAQSNTLELFKTRRSDGEGGRCYNSGCTSGRTCAKYCYPSVGNLASLEVDDNNGEDFNLGVKNCADACAGYGEKKNRDGSRDDLFEGKFVCNSFDYRPKKTTNCYLHDKPAQNTQGNRAGSTRVDYTEYYCYTRKDSEGNKGMNKLPCIPTASPTVAPTVVPTVAPTVESTSCQDDESWTYVNRNGKTRDCAYVARNPDKRCSNAGAEKFAGSVQACCACK